MRQILFVQGGGAEVHDKWDNHLVDSLGEELGSGYEIRYPMMPDEGDPQYGAWKRALQGELAALERGAVVVGHSVGGTILLHVLAERTARAELGAICLIAAPFVGPGGWQTDDIVSPPDLADRLPDAPIFLYHGRDDATVPFAHLELYARALPHAHVRPLPDRDHQLGNSLSEVAIDIRALDRSADANAARESGSGSSLQRP